MQRQPLIDPLNTFPDWFNRERFDLSWEKLSTVGLLPFDLAIYLNHAPREGSCNVGAGFTPARQLPMGGDPPDSPERERWRAGKPLPYDVGYCAEYGLGCVIS